MWFNNILYNPRSIEKGKFWIILRKLIIFKLSFLFLRTLNHSYSFQKVREKWWVDELFFGSLRKGGKLRFIKIKIVIENSQFRRGIIQNLLIEKILDTIYTSLRRRRDVLNVITLFVYMLCLVELFFFFLKRN